MNLNALNYVFLCLALTLPTAQLCTVPEIKKEEGRIARCKRAFMAILQDKRVKIAAGLGVVTTVAVATVIYKMQNGQVEKVPVKVNLVSLEEKRKFHENGMLGIDNSKLSGSTKTYLQDLERRGQLKVNSVGINIYDLKNSGAVLEDIASAKAKLGPQCNLVVELEEILKQLRIEEED